MAMTISGSNGVTYPDGTSQASGSQACKAWVNFNGTGTVAIRASYNVSSITDNGAGDYTVNFTTAMPDANYTTFCSNRENYVTGTSDTWGFLYEGQPTTSATRVQTGQTAGKFDSVEVNVVVFR
jgi:hypothetical protein